MNIVKKALATIVMAGTLVAGGVVAASPAAASTWITPEDVLSISDARTAVEKVTSVGTIQVRYGTYQGRQYGWGRVLNPRSDFKLVFEVDTDGDRVWNRVSPVMQLPGDVHWTSGWPASSSSAVAFRACVISTRMGGCSESANRTSWW